jgi:hypothetical protein
MDVFLVPVGPDAYEMYCEHVDEPEAPAEEVPAGRLGRFSPRFLFGRIKRRFHEMLVEAERERRRENAAAVEGSWFVRVRRRIMRWVAETIAEQRLLWNLRRYDEATLHYPLDLSEPAAESQIRHQLSRDFEKHRFWLAIDSVLMVLSGLLILVPGPNFIGYYFAFRVVGHFFSVRGARNGLDRVVWTKVPNGPLAELRTALSMSAADRLRVAESVASILQLDHLATFFQRTAASS